MKSVKKSKPRIDLSPLMHRLLLAEAAKRGIRPNALVENLIEEASSPEAKALVGMPTSAHVESAPSTVATEEPQREEEKKLLLAAPSSGLQGAEGRKNKTLLPRISKHPEIEEKIIAMYNSGMKSPKIGKATGYSHQTIDSNLDRLRLAGKIK